MKIVLIIGIIMLSTLYAYAEWANDNSNVTYYQRAIDEANKFPVKFELSNRNIKNLDAVYTWRHPSSRGYLVPKEHESDNHKKFCPRCKNYWRNCLIVSWKKERGIWAWFRLRCPRCGEYFRIFEQITQVEKP